jgi:hypothetical protein
MTHLGYARVRSLPREFMILVLGELGQLFVISREPALLVATKLVRGNEQYLIDAGWWMAERSLSRERIEAAIVTLPAKREEARKGLARVR